jgi:hypothetical protein
LAEAAFIAVLGSGLAEAAIARRRPGAGHGPGATVFLIENGWPEG